MPCLTGLRFVVNFSIRIKRSAEKEIRRIAKADQIRIVKAIDELAHNPYSGHKLMGEFRSFRRLRVGAYRIIYEVQETELTVFVVRVAHRSEAYR